MQGIKNYIRSTFFPFCFHIEDQFRRCEHTWIVTTILQFFLFYYMFTFDWLMEIVNSPSIQDVYDIFAGKDMNLFLYIGLSTTIFFLFVLGLYLCIVRNLKKDGIDNERSILPEPFVILAFLIQLTEIMILPINFAIYKNFTEGSSSSSLFLSIFMFFFMILLVFFNREERLMGISLPLLVFATQPVLKIIVALILICQCVYCIMNDLREKDLNSMTTRIRILLHIFIAIICVWTEVIRNYKNYHNSLQDFIYLHCVLFMVIIIWALQIRSMRNNLTDNLFLCQFLKNKRNDTYQSEDLFKVSMIIFEYTERLEDMRDFCFQLTKKTPDEWTEAELEKIILSKVAFEKKQNQSLKIDLDSLKIKSILSKNSFSLMSEVNKTLMGYFGKSILSDYKISHFLTETEKKHLQSKRNEDSVNTILSASKLKEDFFIDCEKIYKLLMKFWIKVGQKFYLQEEGREQMIEIFASIIALSEDMKTILDKIQKKNIEAKRQKQAYRFIESLIHSRTQREDSIDFEDQMGSSFSSNFVRVRNNKIVKISLNLFYELKFKQFGKDLQSLEGEHFHMLMPPSFEQLLEKFWKQYGNDIDDFQPFPFLLVNANQQLLLQMCMPLILPNLYSGVQILYKFSPHEATNSPLLLYNSRTKLITHYNNDFVEHFRLNRRKLYKQVKKHGMITGDLFSFIDFNDKETSQRIQNYENFNCFMKVSFCENEKGKINPKKGCEVNLVLEQKFLLNQSQLLFRLKKGHMMKTGMFFNDTNKKKNRFIVKKASQIMLLGDQEIVDLEQKTFCKIPNPYSIKINEKQTFLESKNRKNFISYITYILVFFTVFVVFETFFYYFLIEVKYESINEYQHLIHERKGEYLCLYQSYYMTHLKRQVQVNQQYLKGKGYNTQKMLTKIEQQNKNYIRSFMKNYLSFQIDEKRYYYNLTFERFSINSDTSKTNLVDFAQNLAVSQLNDSFSFLSNNYQTLKNITKNDNLLPFDSWMGVSTEIIIAIMSFALIIITVIIFIILLCFVWKIDNSTRQIQQLFGYFSVKDFRQLFRQLQKFKDTFEEIDFFDNEEEKIDKKKVKKYQKIEDYSSINLEIQEEKKEEASRQTKFWVCLQEYPLLLPVIFVVVISYFQLSIYTQINDKNDEIIVFHKKIQTIKLIFEEKILDLYVPIMAKELFDRQINTENKIHKKWTFIDTTLDKYFDTFKKTYKQKTYGNICSQSLDINNALVDLECQNVLGGSFKNGITQASEQLDKKLLQLSRSSSLQEMTEKQTSNVPDFLEVNYAISLIQSFFIENLDQNFQENIIKYTQRVKGLLIYFTLIEIAIFFLLAICIGFCLFRRRLKKKCKVGIGYFKAIPSEVLLRMQVTDILRRNNILEKLEVL